METIASNDDVDILFHPEERCIETRWKRSAPGYEDNLSNAAVELPLRGASAWLDDMSGYPGFHPGHARHIRDVLLQPLVAGGLKRFATIFPSDLPEAMTAPTIAKYAAQGVDAKGFHDRAKAWTWIRTSS